MSEPRFHPWLLDVLACPTCSGELATDPRGVLACERCGCLYPVLAGVAVLVPGPDRWVAAHREPILATLAEHGLAGDDALEMVSIFADAGAGAEPRRWNDDWVPSEAWDEPWPAVPERHADDFGRFVAAAEERTPASLVAGELGAVDSCLELGVGAGGLSVLLAPQAERLVLGDVSLRALMTAHERCAELGAEVCPVVVDADRLALRPRSIDAVVAANLIDLLDVPDDFVAAVAAGLRPGGALALVTPDPALGDRDAADVLDDLLADHGLTVAWSEDHVPWLRPHRSREWQVYFGRALVARLAGRG